MHVHISETMFLFFTFSCVIAELFLDGQQLFDLSQLLDYCIKEYNPEQQLKKIADKNIRVGAVCMFIYLCDIDLFVPYFEYKSGSMSLST